MASLTDRIGTSGENKGDDQKREIIWKVSPKVFEHEVVVKLPYAMHFNRGSANSNSPFALHQYKINSIYDPDLTGAGHQPLGRDTWSSIYNYYKVLEAHISVQIHPLTYYAVTDISATPQLAEPTHYALMLDITATPPTSLDTLIMAAMAGDSNRQQIITNHVTASVRGARPPAAFTMNAKWEANMFDTAVLDSSAKDTWTPVGQDPDDINYASIIECHENSTGTRYHYVTTKIEYLVAFKQVNKTLLNTLN